MGGSGYHKLHLSKDDCYICNCKGHHAKDCPKLTSWEKKQLGQGHVNIISISSDGLHECIKGIENANVNLEVESLNSDEESNSPFY